MTRPVALSTMSGNFDFPPASYHHNAPTTEDEADDFRLVPQHRVRDVLRSERTRRDTMEGHTAGGIGERLRRQSVQQSALREQFARRQAAQPSPGANVSTSDTQAPISALRSRPHPIPNERQIRNMRHRHLGEATVQGSVGTVQEAVERLNEASSNLSSLLDRPIPRIGSPDISAREYSGEAEVNRRHAKRRKLDCDSLAEGFEGFTYGYRGQVVPGPLKMEIESCDGGLHADAARHGREYWPENVLRNDKSVYCTDRSKCNIVVRHQGKTAFCLTKLVIKAPERGFTAPIQEGMVFVSMNSEDLLRHTLRYQIREASPSRRSSSSSPVRSTQPSPIPETWGSWNGNRPPEIWGLSNGNRPPSRRVNDAAERTIPPPLSNARPYARQPRAVTTRQIYEPRARRNSTTSSVDDTLRPPLQGANSPNPLFFTVSTNCDDHSGDEEEESSAATLADRYRRDRMPPPYDSSDETEDGVNRWVESRVRLMGVSPHHRRSRRRAAPSRVEIAEPSVGENESMKLLMPHATFFIEREKSMVSIKFDPPVSGKFILLKLWSPNKDQNIDIQSIVAHGFAGPRFFPAAQTM